MFLFFPVCNKVRNWVKALSLMLWEVSVVEVCEMVLEFSKEKEVAAQNVCIHWLSSVSMHSKPPLVLKLFRRSHILCKNALHWCLISARWERRYYQRTASLLLYKAKQKKFWKYWQHTQRRNVAYFFSSWTLEVVSRSQKGLVSIPGFSFASLVVTHCVIRLN